MLDYHLTIFVEHQFHHSLVHVYKRTLDMLSALSSNNVVRLSLIEGSPHDSWIC